MDGVFTLTSGSARSCALNRRSAKAETVFYILYAYTKSEQGDLTTAQARVLGRLVREEFKWKRRRFRNC